MDERITIVIPAKNAGSTLSACLSSLVRQTAQPASVVLVDDSSEDDTVRRAVQFQDRLPLIITKNRTHGAHDGRGAAIARNTGAAGCATPLIFFCDADVVLEPYALALLTQALRTHPRASFAYGPFYFGRIFRVPRYAGWLLRFHNYISTMALIRTEDFLGFDETLSRYQDWDLWLRMARKGRTGVKVRDRIFTTMIRPYSISGGMAPISESTFRRTHKLPKNTWVSRALFKLGVRILSLL